MEQGYRRYDEIGIVYSSNLKLDMIVQIERISSKTEGSFEYF